jgi:DNA-binding NarL/FixJ family response regulator
MIQTSALRILLADDHEILRKGLRSLFEAHSGWTVCGEADNGEEAVRLAVEMIPDIVVLDIGLRGLNGVEAARQIKAANSAIEVLIFTMHDSEDLICETLRVGARGYILKTDKEQTVIDAVDALAKHKPFFTSAVSQTLLDHLLISTERSDETSVLSTRECQVVQLLAEGRSNKEIASAMHISVKTVEAHRSTIMRKLGFTSIVQLVRFAIRNNLVRP